MTVFFFIGTLRGKAAITLLLNILPPNLDCVALLPCEICVCLLQAVVVKRRSQRATVRQALDDVSAGLNMPESTVTGYPYTLLLLLLLHNY